mgnify:CR=1 FL=1
MMCQLYSCCDAFRGSSQLSGTGSTIPYLKKALAALAQVSSLGDSGAIELKEDLHVAMMAKMIVVFDMELFVANKSEMERLNASQAVIRNPCSGAVLPCPGQNGPALRGSAACSCTCRQHAQPSRAQSCRQRPWPRAPA